MAWQGESIVTKPNIFHANLHPERVTGLRFHHHAERGQLHA